MLEQCQDCESWIYLKSARSLESFDSPPASIDFLDGYLIISREPTSLPLTGFHVGSEPCSEWRVAPMGGMKRDDIMTFKRCPEDKVTFLRHDAMFTSLLSNSSAISQKDIEDENGVTKMLEQSRGPQQDKLTFTEERNKDIVPKD